MDYVKDFGLYLKELRLNKGLTIKELSTLSGVSISYLSQVENGKRGIPSKEILEKLSVHLNVECETLFERAGYIKFRDLRNNLVHRGLDDFLEKRDINQFIENTLTYFIEVLHNLLSNKQIPDEKRERLVTLLHTYSSLDQINNEFDLNSFKNKVLNNLNPQGQLFIILSLLDFVQESYSTWYKPNKINEYVHDKLFQGYKTYDDKTDNIVKENTDNKRKIPPGIRFRVLKRDQSTCQICGAKAPQSKIEVDYIVPFVSKDEEGIENLHAICSDCQRGMHEEYFEEEEMVQMK